MSFASLLANGSTNRVTEAEIVLPRWGIWSATVELDRGDSTLAGAVVLTFGALTLKGTIRRGGAYVGSGRYRIYGGADGWSLTIPETSYRPPLARLSTVIADAARLVGETVVLEANVERTLGSYARFKGPASRVLNGLMPERWWIETDGVTHVGDRKVAPAPKIRFLDYDPELDLLDVSEDDVALLPGQTVPVNGSARDVSSVVHRLTDGKLRSELWLS